MAKITAAFAEGYRERNAQRNELAMKKLMRDYEFLQKFMLEQVSPYAKRIKLAEQQAAAQQRQQQEESMREREALIRKSEAIFEYEPIIETIKNENTKRRLLIKMGNIAREPSEESIKEFNGILDEAIKNDRELGEKIEAEKRAATNKQMQAPRQQVGSDWAIESRREDPNGKITPGVIHKYRVNKITGQEEYFGSYAMPGRQQNVLEQFEGGGMGGEIPMEGDSDQFQYEQPIGPPIGPQRSAAPSDTTDIFDWRQYDIGR